MFFFDQIYLHNVLYKSIWNFEHNCGKKDVTILRYTLYNYIDNVILILFA